MHEEQRLATIVSLAESYRFEKPLVLFLRNHFRAHRNMGSRDRKIVTQSIYSLFRLGKSVASLSLSKKIAIALFLCSKQADDFSVWCVQNNSSLKPENISIPLKEKIKVVQGIYSDFSLEDIFPFKKYLSQEIDFEEYVLSLLNKPGIFIRVRKKFKQQILKELLEKNISFKPIEETDSVEILSPIRIEDLLSFQKGYFEIQDLSSQRTGNYFAPSAGSRWWDACAGSGGKSLLLYEKQNSIEILSTDAREKSLLNLKTRFARAGIRSYRTKILNLENEVLNSRERFDGVIVDAPCSGSGTWARSPEQLSSFDEKSIDSYSEKQRKIVQNVMKNLKKSSPIIYITCSVFAKENEENIKYFSETFDLQAETTTYTKGYSEGAGTLFVSKLFQK